MSDKFLHELPELPDMLPDDLVLVSRNETEYKQQRATLFDHQGLGLDYAISDAIIVPAAGLVAMLPGATLTGHNDFDSGVFDYDLGLFTAPYAGVFAFELEVAATSLVSAGAGPLTLKGLANGGDREIASQVVPVPYAPSGGNYLWQGRFCSIALLDEDEDFYFGVSRSGAPAATVVSGKMRIHKLG